MSRARNQAKADGAGKGSQLKQNEAALTLKASARLAVLAVQLSLRPLPQCKICLQPFICTSTEVKLKEHSDNKHPKQAFAGAHAVQAAATLHTDSPAARRLLHRLQAQVERWPLPVLSYNDGLSAGLAAPRLRVRAMLCPAATCRCLPHAARQQPGNGNPAGLYTFAARQRYFRRWPTARQNIRVCPASAPCPPWHRRRKSKTKAGLVIFRGAHCKPRAHSKSAHPSSREDNAALLKKQASWLAYLPSPPAKA